MNVLCVISQADDHTRSAGISLESPRASSTHAALAIRHRWKAHDCAWLAGSYWLALHIRASNCHSGSINHEREVRAAESADSYIDEGVYLLILNVVRLDY